MPPYMKTLSVYASVQEASPTGEHLVHRTITGRLQCPDGPPEARFTALVAAAMAVPDSGLSAGVVARVCAGLAATSWAAAETALPHLDASHVLVHGDLTMHAGTLAPSHQGVRLALPVPGALVTLGAADAPEFTLSLHALPRGSAADEALFFTPFAFLCAPNKVMRLPIENFRAQTPTLMTSHARTASSACRPSSSTCRRSGASVCTRPARTPRCACCPTPAWCARPTSSSPKAPSSRSTTRTCSRCVSRLVINTRLRARLFGFGVD